MEKRSSVTYSPALPNIKEISGAHLGFSEGRGANFKKGASQCKTKKKRI